MPFVELIVLTCLASAPQTCREQHFSFAEGSSLGECMMRAQPWLAEWASRNVRWTVVRWKCGYADQSERDA